MEDEHKEPKPDIGLCARCGRLVKNPHFIGSLLVGRECRKRMLAEGFKETVYRCPLCHQPLDEHQLSVKDDKVLLEPTVKVLSLAEFDGRSKFTPPLEGPCTFQLLSVEVIHKDGSVTPLAKDEQREGKSDDGKSTDSRDDESGRGDGPEDVSGTRRSEGKTESADEPHRKGSDSPDPPEDA